MGYCAASSGNFLATFRDSLSVLFSAVKKGPIGCPEASVKKPPILAAKCLRYGPRKQLHAQKNVPMNLNSRVRGTANVAHLLTAVSRSFIDGLPVVED